ncbi:MAG: hypothetical protein Q9187_004179 [Circinaria calcarea]
MDHLPLPRNPALPPIKVPFVCTKEYDAGPFLTYPDRKGWKISFPDDRIAFLYNGREPLSIEKAAFIQTWLYFGLLQEALGPVFDIACFVTEDGLGSKFLTTFQLERLVKDWTLYLVADKSRVEWRLPTSRSAIEIVKERCTHIYQCILEVRDLALRIGIYDTDPVDSRIFLAIAALGEYLHQAIKDVYIHLGIETPVDQRWRIPKVVDLGQPVLESLRRNGWCPSDVARIDIETDSVGVLYYYSNLQAPRLGKDHSSCFAEKCLALQIDSSTYELAHSRSGCTCSLAVVDHDALARILRSGSIPLINPVDSDGPLMHPLTLRNAEDDIDFVAISHVWAEGLGNPDDNTLHSCLISELSALANRLPVTNHEESMPFWIDTICVPVRPPELQTAALNRMREPYERAKCVLVLDSYLRSLNSNFLSPIEIFARVSCCSWMRRLWTLQEGRLAKRVWFQFADQAVDLGELFKSIDLSRVPSSASRAIDLAIIGRYGASKVNNLFDITYNQDIPSIRAALSVRSVSVSTDEALCLACLVGLDITKVTSVPISQRMQTFWSLMAKVPTGLVFSKAPGKLSQDGFRWAPSTFLGILPRDDWAGPIGLDHQMTGIPTNRGLLCSLPGYILHPNLIKHGENLDDSFVHDMVLRDTNKDWYALSLEEKWNEELHKLNGPLSLALILAQAAHDNETSSLLGLFNIRQTLTGIVALIAESKGSTYYVKAQRHAIFQKLAPGYQTHHNAAKNCAQQALTNEGTIGDLLNSVGEEKCRPYAEAALQDPQLMDLCSAEARHLGAENSKDGIAKTFARWILRFCHFGDRDMVEKTPDNQMWCVD